MKFIHWFHVTKFRWNEDLLGRLLDCHLEDTHILPLVGLADGLCGNPIEGRLQVIPVTAN